MVGGQVGGIAGPYLSVPTVAVLRIVWRECFSTGTPDVVISEKPVAQLKGCIATGQFGKGSTRHMQNEEFDGRSAEARLGELHVRIQSRLDELHSDFKQLAADVREGRRKASRARKDRIEGFKRALRDLLQAAERADQEWK
jgi:hypothetical protein